jgi:hypothetical protein
MVLNVEVNLNRICFLILFPSNSVGILPGDMVHLIRVPDCFVLKHPVWVQLNFNPVNFAHSYGLIYIS